MVGPGDCQLLVFKALLHLTSSIVQFGLHFSDNTIELITALNAGEKALPLPKWLPTQKDTVKNKKL